MQKTTMALWFAATMGMASGAAHAARGVSCENELRNVNTALQENGAAPLNDIKGAVQVLRSLRSQGRLPARYITTDEARRLGWSGRDTDTLWGLKPTNQKWIGGDAYSSRVFPHRARWYTADLEVQRGYRSNKRLAYSLQSPRRFVSTDGGQHWMEVDPCQ